MTINEWIRSLTKRQALRLVWELTIKPKLALTLAVLLLWAMGQNLEEGRHFIAVVELIVAVDLILSTIRQQIRVGYRLRMLKTALKFQTTHEPERLP